MRTYQLANKYPRSAVLQMVLEAFSGTLAAVPIGMFLYYMPVLLWASMWGVFALPIVLIPNIGSKIAAWMNFTSTMVPFLAMGAVGIEVWACRFLIKRHYQVFAYTQAVLGLAVSFPFFYWTMVHQKPMIPFYGQ